MNAVEKDTADTNTEHTSDVSDAEQLSQQISSDAVNQAALHITQKIDNLREQEQEKPVSFSQKIKLWLIDQVERMSQTVITLVAATLVAVLTPFLVKFQIVDELDTIYTQFTSTLDSSNQMSAQQNNTLLSEQSLLFTQKNDEIENTVNTYRDEIALLSEQSNENASTQEQHQAIIISRLQQQSEQLEKLSKLAADMPSRIHIPVAPNNQPTIAKTSHQLQFPGLSRQISLFIEEGTQLTRGTPNPGDVEHWLGEAYFFVSLIPKEFGDMSASKTALRQVYTREKPFRADPERVAQTLVILKALERWSKQG